MVSKSGFRHEDERCSLSIFPLVKKSFLCFSHSATSLLLQHYPKSYSFLRRAILSPMAGVEQRSPSYCLNYQLNNLNDLNDLNEYHIHSAYIEQYRGASDLWLTQMTPLTPAIAWLSERLLCLPLLP
jgi:hypothetical protein